MIVPPRSTTKASHRGRCRSRRRASSRCTEPVSVSRMLSSWPQPSNMSTRWPAPRARAPPNDCNCARGHCQHITTCGTSGRSGLSRLLVTPAISSRRIESTSLTRTTRLRPSILIFDIADLIDLSSAPRTTAALNPTYVSSRRRRHDAQLAKDRLAFRAQRLTLRNDEFGLNISRLFNAVWDYDIDQMVWDTIAGIDRPQSADDVKDSVEICNDPRDILR